MERTTADPRSVRRHLSSPGVALPEDLIVGEILVRLPAKSLFRFRAACRSWCNRTSTHQFISSFGRKLPLVGLYSNPLKSLHDKSGLECVDVLAAANNLRSVLTFDCYSNWLCASLDGLLLVSYGNGRHIICNPATRQSIPLPQLTGGVVAGLYSSPTADRGVEYRTLFSKGRLPICNPKYYILTVGSPMEPRPVQLPEEPDNLKIALLHGINDPTPSLCHRPTVMLNSCLHWVPESCRHDKVVVFDTVAESFRSIQSPTAAQENTRLFEMGSQLGFSLYNGRSDTVSIWSLHDYNNEIWALRHSINLSMVVTSSMRSYMILSDKGDVLISCRGSSQLIHCDTEANVLNQLTCEPRDPSFTGHWFKENISRHDFFQRKKGQRLRQQTRFLKGL